MAVGPDILEAFLMQFPTVGVAALCDKRSTSASRFLLAVFALLLLTLPSLAQSTAGRILGTVTDPSGAAVAGASVVVTDTQRGFTRTVTTDEAGEYTASDLQPGTYSVQVEAKGFKKVERPTVQIEVASDVRADFALPAGQVNEVVTINEDIPLLNTTSATLGGTLSNQEINDLPLNGRNYENLLQLRPGVMRDALSRWRIFHHQQQRPARRRQFLLHRRLVQQRALLRTSDHQRRGNRGGLGHHSAD
jgi:hypothetical protein